MAQVFLANEETIESVELKRPTDSNIVSPLPFIKQTYIKSNGDAMLELGDLINSIHSNVVSPFSCRCVSQTRAINYGAYERKLTCT